MKQHFTDFFQLLEEAPLPYGSISSDATSLIQRYFGDLIDWNQRMALISKAAEQHALISQIYDSIHIVELTRAFLGRRKVIDIGSGAGFPGMIFSILNSKIPITLYEKVQKKRMFLEHSSRVLELSRIKIESVVPPRLFNVFAYARAVRPPSELLAWMKKVLQSQSRLVICLGGKGQEPFSEGGFRRVHEVTYGLPLDFGSRKIIILERM